MYKFMGIGILFLLLYARQITAQTSTPAPCDITITPTYSPTPTATQILNYENIYISEVMVDPLSGDLEWLELYNDNIFDVSLTGWKIDDIADGGASPKNITVTITSKNFSVVDFSSALFNNDTDFVRLLDSSGNLKDSFEYTASIKGKTIGRSPNEFNVFCFQEPSKNLTNTSCLNSGTPTPTITIIAQLNISPTITLKPTVLAAVSRNSASAKSSFLPIKDVQAATIDDPLNIKTLSEDFFRDSGKTHSLTFIAPLTSIVFSLLSAGTILLKMRIDIV